MDLAAVAVSAVLKPSASNPEIGVSVDLALDSRFGVVLAGAIFGDHTSPLYDTTILSSIGSGIQLFDHTTTQIPF
jgi:tetracycline resistance efflux pump